MTHSASDRFDRYRLAAVATSALAGVLVYLLATQVFPYHTTNHDEAVYLQQAAMLLDGQLFLNPPVEGAFRPWFFVEDGGRLYPKYAPVPSAMFAVGALFGSYRFALPGIAAGVVGLTYWTVTEAFDRPTGLLAAALLLASPLFLVNASVFLPYVPTTLLNLCFAGAYLRADRTDSRGFAALAGVAIGLAFFSRPYTAVLFALPFVAHALWTLRDGDQSVVVRQGLTAALGLAGVALALAYNAVVTGDPLLFPYEAFAPRDGLGFGHRQILGYQRDYTPALALRANAEVVWLFATRWVVAGILGTAFAVGGTAITLRRSLTAQQATIAGLFLTVPLGNVLFWGNLNVLGDLDRAGDGLVSLLGTYYHVDLLVPTVAFAAVGVLALGRWLRTLTDANFDPRLARRVTLVTLLVGAAVGGVTTVAMAAEPLADSRAVTEQYEQAYEPFETRSLDDSVVFLPTPYGEWLNHPFQPLRNDPGYDDGPVYALHNRPFAVVDAFPDRTYYRYVYRGPWSPEHGDPVDARLERVHVAEGEQVRQEVDLGVPAFAESVSIRIASDAGREYASATADSNLSMVLDVGGGNATLRGDSLGESVSVPVDDRDTLVLTAFVDYGTGAGFHYQVELPVERTDDGVRALSSYDEVCHGAGRCGGEAAYVPGHREQGVFVRTNLTTP